jgi:trigger factor
LKIETEYLEDHQVKLSVEIDVDPLERAKRRAARKIAKRIKIPGFRPGKAPYGVILRHVGEGAIMEDALDILISDIYPKIIEEADIEPHGPGTLEEVVSLDPPKFDFLVPLRAEVTLGDYRSIRIPFECPEVTEEDVNDALNNLLERRAVVEPVERPAEPGDLVFAQVGGRRVQEEEGEDNEVFPSRFSTIVIPADDETRDDEWPYPGFSREMIGVSKDDEKEVTYTYPDDYKDEDLSGVEVLFHAKVTNIQSRKLPELNDDFARELGEFESVDELIANLRDALKEQTQEEYDNEYDEEVVQTLVEESEIKYPPQMIDQELDDMLSGLENRLSQQGLTKELYLQMRGIDEDALLEELKPIAVSRIKRAMVLYEVAEVENIEVDQEEFQEQSGRTMAAISESLSKQEAKRFEKSGYVSSLLTSIMVDMVTKMTIEYLRSVSKGEVEVEDTEDEETKSMEDESPKEDKSEEEEKSPDDHVEPEGSVDNESDKIIVSDDSIVDPSKDDNEESLS